MRYELEFPKDQAQREMVLNNLLKEGEQMRKIREVNWWLCHYYLQGVRTFSNINYKTGTLDVSYVDAEGLLNFRWDYIVKQYQTQLGRLGQLDLSPLVSRRSIGLEDLKKASVGQVALDYVMPRQKVDRVVGQVGPTLLKYGCAGLFVWYEREMTGIEVVPPWEIVPLPPNPVEEGELVGVAWSRMIPLEWVKRMKGVPGPQADVWNEMDKVSVPRGTSIKEETEGHMVTFQQVVKVPQGATGKRKDDTVQDMVKFSEVFTYTRDMKMKQYTLMAGGKEIGSQDFKMNNLEVPLQIANDITTGGFWGRSFVSVLLPINTEMEWTIGRVFQNLQDTDTMGVVCVPTTIGMSAKNIFRDKDGVRKMMYEPDYMAPKDLSPFNMAPANLGMAPMKGVEIGMALADKLASQPNELMGGKAPGRVDSNQALGSLMEMSNIPLAPTAKSLANAMGACYRVMLGLLKTEWPKNKLIEVTYLDDSLAGVQLEPKSGQISLERNVLPNPDEVEVGVRSTSPKSKEQEKMEWVESLKLGMMDMFEFRVGVREKGLDIPVGNEAEWQNYRRAKMENVQLFGDGIEPGSVIVSEDDIPMVHLKVLDAFKARPEYYAASPAVRSKFTEHRKAHLAQMGTYPDQLPPPEEAAVEEDDMQKQMARMMGGGAMGGPAPEQEMPMME